MGNCQSLDILPEHYPAPLPLASTTVATTPHTEMNINAVTPFTTVPTHQDFTQTYPIIISLPRSLFFFYIGEGKKGLVK